MHYQICTQCVMDTSDTEIEFNANGVCNHCRKYFLNNQRYLNQSAEFVIQNIRVNGRKKRYDCIVGISGGVDSSFLLHYLIKQGLRPLPVHIDMGWNSKNAVENIKLLLAKLQLELCTYVVDWSEFRSVQLAYLRSGIIDTDVPTDHAYICALYNIAAKKGIKTIITGHNYRTESIMPTSWIADKKDARNLLDIYKKNGGKYKLKSFPIFHLYKKFIYYNIKQIKEVHLLNFVQYDRDAAIKELIREYNWQPHPVKHGESIWTRFFQCYILPRKFGIDKRRAHLSNQICSKQITRHDALKALKENIYPKELEYSDKEFVLKKLGLSYTEFDNIIHASAVGFDFFKTEEKIKARYHKIARFFRNFGYHLKYSDRY